MYVCKQTFHTSKVHISQTVRGVIMQNHCALSYWTKSTNSQCGEQQYTAAYPDPDLDPDLQKKRALDILKKWTLHQNLLYELKTHFRQIWGCWFQIWQYFFKILVQKFPNKTFLVPDLGFFVFSQNFAIRQIWGSWFQIHDNSIFKILPQKYPNKAFLFPDLDIFVYLPHFAVR